jgi:hypothetical protein
MNPTAFNNLLEIGPGDSFLGGPNSPHFRHRSSSLGFSGDEINLGTTGHRPGESSVDPQEVARQLRKIDTSNPEWLYELADRMGLDPDDEQALEELDRIAQGIIGDSADELGD